MTWYDKLQTHIDEESMDLFLEVVSKIEKLKSSIDSLDQDQFVAMSVEIDNKVKHVCALPCVKSIPQGLQSGFEEWLQIIQYELKECLEVARSKRGNVVNQSSKMAQGRKGITAYKST